MLKRFEAIFGFSFFLSFINGFIFQTFNPDFKVIKKNIPKRVSNKLMDIKCYIKLLIKFQALSLPVQDYQIYIINDLKAIKVSGNIS